MATRKSKTRSKTRARTAKPGPVGRAGAKKTDGGDDESARKQIDLSNRRRAVISKQIADERRAAAKTALDEAARAMKSRGVGRPLLILAEGDSWFHYPETVGIVKRIANRTVGKAIVCNLAHFGDELGEMMDHDQRMRLIEQLTMAVKKKTPWDALLMSGGGNDVIGRKGFTKWLNDFKPGMTPREVLNLKDYGAKLAELKGAFNQLVALRDQHSPSTHLFIGAYDFPIPDGKKACGIAGPWLLPGLKQRGVPQALHYDVVKEFLMEFAAMVKTVVAASPGVTLVPTQGQLQPIRKWWLNEIHPSSAGYKHMAEVFIESLKAQFPGRL